MASLLAPLAPPEQIKTYHNLTMPEALLADFERWKDRPIMRWIADYTGPAGGRWCITAPFLRPSVCRPDRLAYRPRPFSSARAAAHHQRPEASPHSSAACRNHGAASSGLF